MPQKRRRAVSGSFQSVVEDYLKSTHYRDKEPGTQANYRRYLMLVAQPDHLGGLPAMGERAIHPADVQEYIDGFAALPGKQANIKAALSAVQKWARVRRRLQWSITEGVECIETGGGHVPWTDEQVAYAVANAREDLARALLLMACTGQRGSDIVKMRWSDLETVDGLPGINVTQRKTGLRLWIPLEPQVVAALATWEKRAPFYLVQHDQWKHGQRPQGGWLPDATDEAGNVVRAQKGYSRDLLSWHWNKQRKRPDLAEVSGLTLHGLRGYRVVTLRKRGHTELEISNMVGMSAPMVTRYCRFADQKAMASAAFYRLSPRRKDDVEAKR